MPDPRDSVMDLVFGRRRSQILYTGVALGVFDALGGGPRPADRLADTLNVDRFNGYRLFRALGALELLRESSDRTFALTEAGDLEHVHPGHPSAGVVSVGEGQCP